MRFVQVGARVALAVLVLSRAPAFCAHVDALAAAWRLGVEGLIAAHPGLIVGLRQLGMFMGLVLSSAAAGPVFTRTAFDEV